MANRFLTSIYGKIQTSNNLGPVGTQGTTNAPGLEFYQFFGLGGNTRSFSNPGVEIRAVSPKQTLNGVDINSIIVVLPTGLNQREVWYGSSDPVTTLNTAGA